MNIKIKNKLTGSIKFIDISDCYLEVKIMSSENIDSRVKPINSTSKDIIKVNKIISEITRSNKKYILIDSGIGVKYSNMLFNALCTISSGVKEDYCMFLTKLLKFSVNYHYLLSGYKSSQEMILSYYSQSNNEEIIYNLNAFLDMSVFDVWINGELIKEEW